MSIALMSQKRYSSRVMLIPKLFNFFPFQQNGDVIQVKFRTVRLKKR